MMLPQGSSQYTIRYEVIDKAKEQADREATTRE